MNEKVVYATAVYTGGSISIVISEGSRTGISC